MIETSWLVGSTYVPATDITIDGSAAVFPAGYYYLRHTTAALSLVDTLDDLLADEGITGHQVYVARDRKVRIVCTAGSEFPLVWPAALRGLFGFTTNLPGTDAIEIAEGVSPLLWSAGKPHSPQEAPFGARGRSVYDTRLGTAPDGTQVADSHHTQIVNQFTWNHVAYTRFQTADPGVGGEYVTFFDTVLRNAFKFYLYAFVQENLAADDTAVSWPTSTNKLGPYGYRATRGAISWDFARSSGHQNTGRFNQVSLDTLIVPEWETT